MDEKCPECEAFPRSCMQHLEPTTLPAAEFEALVAWLDNPPEPNEKLRELLSRTPPWDA